MFEQELEPLALHVSYMLCTLPSGHRIGIFFISLLSTGLGVLFFWRRPWFSARWRNIRLQLQWKQVCLSGPFPTISEFYLFVQGRSSNAESLRTPLFITSLIYHCICPSNLNHCLFISFSASSPRNGREKNSAQLQSSLALTDSYWKIHFYLLNASFQAQIKHHLFYLWKFWLPANRKPKSSKI